MKDFFIDHWTRQLAERADAAAGHPSQMVHRARSYHAVYVASEGICCFALVAAHGALWANWYLRCARLAALVLAVRDIRSSLTFRQKMQQFDDFTAALREINRQVMAATYTLVHAIRDLGPEAAAGMGLPPDLCRDMAQAMAEAGKGRHVPDAVKRDLYARHFKWEQKRVVGGILQDCFDRFSWRLMRRICLRPWVWFAYFRPGESLNFRDFLDEGERVEKGLAAFDRASGAGWRRTERRFCCALKTLGRRPV